MQHDVVPRERFASPYRQHDDSRRGAKYRIRYWPRLTPWPLLVVLLLGTPLAWSLRRESRTPSTVTCSTAPDMEIAPACLVHDARKVGPPERVACDDTVPALHSMLDVGNPFSSPHVSATVLTTPELPKMTFTPSSNVFINGAPAAVMTKPKTTDARLPRSKPLAAPATDASGGISASDARALLNSCVAQAGAPGEIRHVTLSIYERDFLWSGVALAGVLLLIVMWMTGRRVIVRSDGLGVVEVLERGWFGIRRRSTFSVAQAERAVVTSGASGPFRRWQERATLDWLHG
jgi:hypothetical protein